MDIDGSVATLSPTAASLPLQVESAPSHPPRILLIIDDDEDAHFLLKRAISKLGLNLEAISAFDGNEGVDYLRLSMLGEASMPALVFLDLKMPEMNGFEVLEWASAAGLLNRLPVAMFTSSDDPRDVARATELGAHTFLAKPAKADQLKRVVSDAINRLAAEVAPANKTPRSLLVVDDSAAARRYAREIVEPLGFAVTEAASATEALRLFGTLKPVVVLLDVITSEAGGQHVMPTLRAENPSSKIIVMIADQRHATEQLLLAAGAAGVIRKPLTQAKLLAVLAAHSELSSATERRGSPGPQTHDGQG